MHVVDDGSVAISIQPRGGKIRLLDHVPTEDEHHPEYVGVVDFNHLKDDLVSLEGAVGAMTRRHMRLIVGHLMTEGYRIAYVDRAPGRVMPFAERISEGDFAGWWRVDLVAIRLLGKRT